jgi:hypothetical protein
MLVQTTQGYDLRIFTGRINLELGTYKHDLTIKGNQRKLYDMLIGSGRLDNDQVVWCVQNKSPIRLEAGQFLHEIDVDARDIATFVDSLAWCHINGYGPRYILPEDHQALRCQARRLNSADSTAMLRQLEAEYLEANLPSDPWSVVLKDVTNKLSDQFLLKFPFGYSKIVDVKVVTEDMATSVH